jgi:hypothetical protein
MFRCSTGRDSDTATEEREMKDSTWNTILRRTALAVAALGALAVTGTAWAAPATFSRPLVVKVGEKRSFTRSELRPGATVKCTYRGHSLSLAAPAGREAGNGVAWPATQAPGFFLNVIGKPGGKYSVSCGRGGSALVL